MAAPTDVTLATDSSSCRAFSERQGVGKSKHVETKFLWLQQEVKKSTLKMEGVSTLLNVSDLGTTGLSAARRAFLLYLLGVVQRGDGKSYVAVGEDQFNEFMAKQDLKKSMKNVRRLMLQSMVEDGEIAYPRIPKSMVKAVTPSSSCTSGCS